MRFRDIGSDRSGGIEGLPLQLMIIILVATMGTAIIVGWMGDIETPKSIGEVETPGPLVDLSDPGFDGLTIVVRDQDGEFLKDAVVIFQDNFVSMKDGEGNRVPASATTDGEGRAVFQNLTVDPPGGSENVILDVLVYKSGYGEKTVDFMVRI